MHIFVLIFPTTPHPRPSSPHGRPTREPLERLEEPQDHFLTHLVSSSLGRFPR